MIINQNGITLEAWCPKYGYRCQVIPWEEIQLGTSSLFGLGSLLTPWPCTHAEELRVPNDGNVTLVSTSFNESGELTDAVTMTLRIR